MKKFNRSLLLGVIFHKEEDAMQKVRRFSFLIVVAVAAIGAWSADAWALSTNSSPIALTSDDKQVWVVNPDNDSVSVLNVEGDANTKLAEIPVGDEPQCVAITPDDATAYVTNQISGTVSVINVASRQVIKTLKVGTEPFGCALTPDGKKLYVSNFNSENVSVISTAKNKVLRTIKNVGPKPRGIATTADGRVYVTLFLAPLQAGQTPAAEGQDGVKEGRVVVINSAKDKVLTTFALNVLQDTGFKSNGATLFNVDPTKRGTQFVMGDATTQILTTAHPNLLEAVVIRGNRGYVPNTCQSPDGPFRFNVNVQSCLSVFDTTNNQDSNQTLNMNKNLANEPVGQRLFNTNPFAIAFKHSADEGFAVLGATNRIIKVVLAADGTPTVNAPAAPVMQTPIVRIEVGKNPRGIVINSSDTRAYVMNFISRDVSSVNLTTNPPVKLADIPSAALPAVGSLDEKIHRGEELFNTSIGPQGTQENATSPAGRMSDFGWGSCYGCHPNGLHDGQTWMFPDGPRQTISMESTAEHPQDAIENMTVNANGAPILPTFHERMLNWSAVRDEIVDFERNIRLVSGGQGLIDADISTIGDFFPLANTGRSADLDKIATYISFGIRAPISPLQGNFREGRRAFEKANCQLCHGGPDWTSSLVDFAPPPVGETIVEIVSLAKVLRDVQTFDVSAFNEVRAQNNAQVTLDLKARGSSPNGFNPASLLSVHAGAPYLHNGACPDLECVLDSVVHRSAGTGGIDTLSSKNRRFRLIKFLRSIDANTPTFP